MAEKSRSTWFVFQFQVLPSGFSLSSLSPMAPEIEKFLLEKFQKGLDLKDKNAPKIHRHSQFQEIRTSLEEIFNSSSPVGVDPSIRQKLYYLNNVFAECQMLSRKHGFNSLKELLTINRIRRELNKIKKELKQLMMNKEETSRGSTIPQPSNSERSSEDSPPITTCLENEPTVCYGFDNEVVSMKKLLIPQGRDDHRFKGVGIVGREGMGKTTLSQKIFNDPEVEGYFLPRIWVCMVRHPGDDNGDPRIAMVIRMLESLGVEKKTGKSVFENHGLAGLLCALHLKLTGKRYLIVLDDARETDPWYGQLDSCSTRENNWNDGLALGLPKGHGGRVIVTSRNEEIAKMMVGVENIHHLLPISDPESFWEIFKDAVEDGRILSNAGNLEDLKLEIKQKCGGLPLAAKMLGEAMQEKVKEEAS